MKDQKLKERWIQALRSDQYRALTRWDPGALMCVDNHEVFNRKIRKYSGLGLLCHVSDMGWWVKSVSNCRFLFYDFTISKTVRDKFQYGCYCRKCVPVPPDPRYENEDSNWRVSKAVPLPRCERLFDVYPPADFVEKVGLSWQEQRAVIDIEREGYGFKTIADHVEKHF